MYTEDQIKAAFWAKFHGSGELWFPYSCAGDNQAAIDECRIVTDSEWQEFLSELKTVAKRPIPDFTPPDLGGGA